MRRLIALDHLDKAPDAVILQKLSSDSTTHSPLPRLRTLYFCHYEISFSILFWCKDWLLVSLLTPKMMLAPIALTVVPSLSARQYPRLCGLHGAVLTLFTIDLAVWAVICV